MVTKQQEEAAAIADAQPLVEAPAPNVIQALTRVMRDLPAIGRDSQASQQQGGYAYRGIEQITAHTQGLFAKHGVVFVPRVVSWEIRDITVGGKPWTDTIEQIEYTVYGPGGADDRITIGPLLAIGRDNSDKGANKCQPAGTLVRVPKFGPFNDGRTQTSYTEVPIETVRAGDRVVTWRRNLATLRSSGRLVTAVMARPFDGQLVTVATAGATSRYTPDHPCIIHPGEHLDEGNHVVYLMRRGDQFRIGRCLWNMPGIRKRGPVSRTHVEGGDAAWVLSVHGTAADAALAEALTALRFGIPETGFSEGSGERRRHSMDLTVFWSKVGDNTRQADDCLRSHGLILASPLFRRPPVRGGRWVAPDGVAAANVRGGMMVPVADGPTTNSRGWQRWPTAWQPVSSVNREFYTGTVYSLDVDDDHNYVADGIVTHNCNTQAFKYALLQALCISDSKDDADGTTHEADMGAPPPDPALVARDEAARKIKALPDDQRAAVKAFCEDNALALVSAGWDDDQLAAVLAHVDSLSVASEGQQTLLGAPESDSGASGAQRGGSSPLDAVEASVLEAAIAAVKALSTTEVEDALMAVDKPVTGVEPTDRATLSEHMALHPETADA